MLRTSSSPERVGKEKLSELRRREEDFVRRREDQRSQRGQESE
jgi:hypothetical protein